MKSRPTRLSLLCMMQAQMLPIPDCINALAVVTLLFRRRAISFPRKTITNTQLRKEKYVGS